MNAAPFVFLVIAGFCLLLVPRRLAAFPLLLAACYTTRAPIVELGPAHLSVLRVLVLVGLVRVAVRGERIAGGWNSIDTLLAAWATVLIAFSVFHTSDAWTFRIGLMLGELGVYFLCRAFLQDDSDVRRVFIGMSLALAPLAALMLLEKVTAQTYFDAMGGGTEVTLRNGYVRAAGPFAHPILAGTVGATFVPVSVFLWTAHHRITALLGLCAALGIVFASSSSGPVLMTAASCAGIFTWRARNHLRLLRWGAVAVLVFLQAIMNDPVYFLVARIDIAGGSTGWFRAQLIRASLEHLSEWWIVGTDYTRHWMPSGIAANAHHTDITNHLLALGVMGGLPVVALFAAALWAAFRAVGRLLVDGQGSTPEHAFLAWTLGAMLFGQFVTFWSISLFDQSISFLYLIVASIGAVHMTPGAQLSSIVEPRQVTSPQLRIGRWRWSDAARVQPTWSRSAAHGRRRDGRPGCGATASDRSTGAGAALARPPVEPRG